MTDQNNSLLPLTSQYVFSKLFGRKGNENLLMSLANALLDGRPSIENAELDFSKSKMRTDYVGSDIIATANNNVRFFLRMVEKNVDHVNDRIVSHRLALQYYEYERAENRYDLPYIANIWICTGKVTNRNGCLHDIAFMFKPEDGEKPSDKLILDDRTRQILVELPNLTSVAEEHMTKEAFAWLHFINDPASTLKECYPVINEAMNKLKEMSADATIRAEYEASLSK